MKIILIINIIFCMVSILFVWRAILIRWDNKSYSHSKLVQAGTLVTFVCLGSIINTLIFMCLNKML